ncbi:MAG: YitT family protein, partial [Clostridia bacterium]|nr:YitT family protein [Clostridia bacterium]
MKRIKGEKTERQKKPRSEKSQKAAKTATYWVVLNLGMLMLAAGVFFFKGPNNFATGGVSGISIILSKYITPHVHWLSQTVIMNAINVLLLIVGFIFLGRGCTVKTAYCCIVYNLEMYVMELIFKSVGVEISSMHTLTNEKFLEFILAMFLTGAGSAIIFNCGASSGGTDIIALILKKFTKVPIGTALLITDALIACSTFFIFDVTTGLFSILGLTIKAFLVDSVIESIGKSKYVTIITSHPEIISPFILDTIHRGFTSFEAEGGFTHEKKTVMITVLK